MVELIIIFSFILITVMLSFAFGSSMHKRQIAYRERKEAIERERQDANPGGTAKAYQLLEERVRVLERIATDTNPTLASQIEELRQIDHIEEEAR